MTFFSKQNIKSCNIKNRNDGGLSERRWLKEGKRVGRLLENLKDESVAPDCIRNLARFEILRKAPSGGCTWEVAAQGDTRGIFNNQLVCRQLKSITNLT